MSARVLLADDHQIVREGFRAILERAGFEVTAEASDGWEAVRLAQTRHPDVVILDVSMPMLNGMDAAREILARAPRLPVVLLTVHTEEHCVINALRAGVRGYVIKTQGATELLDALREVLAGGTYLSPKASSVVVQSLLGEHPAAEEPLTLRGARGPATAWRRQSDHKDIAAALDLT